MSAPDIDRDVMSNFDALAGDAELTIVLGAGASASVGLPDWDTLTVRVAVASGIVPNEDAARLLLSKQDPTILLEGARQRAGQRWDEILQVALYGERLIVPEQPSPLHLATAEHYFASNGKTTVATLNFDPLMEYALLSGAEEVITSLDGEIRHDEVTVHHLHGFLVPNDSEQTVVGFRDFADLVAHDNPWQRDFLRSALQRGPLLFSGTSYRDPDIRHWLHVILRDENPPHRPVVNLIRQSLGLTRGDFEALSDALVAEWEAIGLRALPLHDLADAATVIRELQHARDEGYLSPKERALIVWDRHTERLAALQPQYSGALEDDAQRVREALGVRVHRATLWLADGRGHLARWATEGATFARVRDLKRIPSGHDSPWIAGEAIGAEEVKIQDVDRDDRIRPSWRSVLAVPIYASDGRHPDFATGVVTFGLGGRALTLLEREDDWRTLLDHLRTSWGTRISSVAFPQPPALPSTKGR